MKKENFKDILLSWKQKKYFKRYLRIAVGITVLALVIASITVIVTRKSCSEVNQLTSQQRKQALTVKDFEATYSKLQESKSSCDGLNLGAQKNNTQSEFEYYRNKSTLGYSLGEEAAKSDADKALAAYEKLPENEKQSEKFKKWVQELNDVKAGTY